MSWSALAAAGRAGQREQFAALHGQVDALQCRDHVLAQPVRLVHATQFDDSSVHSAPFSIARALSACGALREITLFR